MAELEAALGHRFADPTLLERALTHRSLEAEDSTEASNERLEFLGDAVLGLVIADHLHQEWDLQEGSMAKVRAAVVNTTSLATVARDVGLGPELRLGRGEASSGGERKSSILADAMEAVIGAIYLDGGLDAARSFVLTHWRPLVAERTAAPGARDYKTRLQEVLAGRGQLPDYHVSGSGPDHARMFSAEIVVAGDVLGSGTGTSKKRAEQEAARRALEALSSDA